MIDGTYKLVYSLSSNPVDIMLMMLVIKDEQVYVFINKYCTHDYIIIY